jgi:hypothetical protein
MLAGLAPTQLPPFRGGGREHVGERWSACLRRLLPHSAPMTCFPLRAHRLQHVQAHRLQHVQAPRSKAAEARHHKHTSTRHANRQARERHDQRHRAAHAVVPSAPLPIEISASLPPDLAAVKQAIELVRQRRPREATALATTIRDQLMQKLVEWVLLRQPESEVGFERYAAFIRTNPDWPSIPLFRRRAEAKLSQERRDGVSARRLLGEEPTSSMDRTSRKPEVHAAQETMARASPARAQAYRPQ